MPSPALEAIAIDKHFGPHRAIQGLNISLYRGRVTGLLGLNGAGKSTVLQILSGAQSADSGDILFDGAKRTLAHQQHIGYVGDPPLLHLDQRVDEFLGYLGRLRGLKGKSLCQRLEHCKRLCQLQAHGRRLISQLSQGFRRRVGLAQALLHDPDILLLDEPSSGLDPLQMSELRHLICQLGEHKAILLSSHSLPEVQHCCQEVLLLHQGQVMQQVDLSATAQASIYELRLQQHYPPEQLQPSPGCEQISVLGAGRYHLTLQPQHISAFHRFCVEQQLPVLSFAPKPSDLETLFLSLNAHPEEATT